MLSGSYNLRDGFETLFGRKVNKFNKHPFYAKNLKNTYCTNMLPEIPQGQTREEMNIRKKIIKDFYAIWNAANPTKHIYNNDLQDFISVRYLSLQETSLIAALSYKSTLAVTYLTEILEKAKVEQRVKPKPDNQNQKRFSEMILMKYDKKEFGKIKLTVGVLKCSRRKFNIA